LISATEAAATSAHSEIIRQPRSIGVCWVIATSSLNKLAHALNAAEMSDVRAALTNKLLELANCGDPRFELKALELLGKHSDIALFTERSEVTVTYKNSSDLEEAIKERVKRLLNARDITPEHTVNANNLDEVLGIVDMGTPVEVNAEATVDESESKK
jgi:hypothetical protein